MRPNDEARHRTEKSLLEAIEHAAQKVLADQEPEAWARAAADLAIAHKALTHYDDAPIGLGMGAPARKG